jgi:two-component system sensor histidine kinase VicK
LSAIDVQVRFAAEFALFLVSLAGLGFAFLRVDLLVERPFARAASAAGFASLAAAALCSGTLIVDEPTDPIVVGLRFAGIVLLGASSVSWRADRAGRELLRIGLVALVAAEIILIGDESSTVADVARMVGALGIGACLVGASARVISARIAASGALVLFAVITVVSVSLSAIVSDNIEDEALRRYSARAQTQATSVTEDALELLPSAKLFAGAIGGDVSLQPALRRLTDPSRDLDTVAADRTAVTGTMEGLVSAFVTDQDPQRGPTVVVDTAQRAVVTTTPVLDNLFYVDLVATGIVTEGLRSATGTQGVAVVEGRPIRLATYPLQVDGQVRGVVVRTSMLDEGYLERELPSFSAEVPGAAMALADRTQVLASAGPRVDTDAVLAVAAAALDGGQMTERTRGERFFAARAVDVPAGPGFALVVSAPRVEEDATREDLFRVLFLVSMGAATAALVLAGVAGERIGSGLRRLTEAATAIQSGNLDARAQVATDDELGTLGRSFDAMAVSLGDLTRDLRTAAHDEATLRGRLEAVVGGMGEALVAVDGAGRITDFNTAAEELFDVPAREARGKVITDVVQLRSQDGTNLSRRLRRPVLEGWTDNGSIRISGGREVPVAVSAGTLRGPDGEVSGAVFVLRDERRERELDRMKTEFLANISHELRTPLTPIKGFASILQTRQLPADKARGFADEISVAADQMERVIGQLVNFSTIVGGRLSIDPKPLAVRGLVDGVLKPWRERVQGTHKLVRRIPAGMPPVVADETYLTQALEELVDNAVKYSPDGGKIVVAAAVVDGEDGPEVEITVSDQGVGIPADRLDSVLEDFTQADASSTRRFGGLGLGLALVNRIAKAHNGSLQVTSSPGAGTSLALRLPVDGPPRSAR